MRIDLRSFDIAELGPLHLDPGLSLAGRCDNLVADVLTLSITIRPDDEELAVPGLLCDVVRESLFVLAFR